jgi:hypothetical protein
MVTMLFDLSEIFKPIPCFGIAQMMPGCMPPPILCGVIRLCDSCQAREQLIANLTLEDLEQLRVQFLARYGLFLKPDEPGDPIEVFLDYLRALQVECEAAKARMEVCPNCQGPSARAGTVYACSNCGSVVSAQSARGG